jgi:hypothetical protein
MSVSRRSFLGGVASILAAPPVVPVPILGDNLLVQMAKAKSYELGRAGLLEVQTLIAMMDDHLSLTPIMRR